MSEFYAAMIRGNEVRVSRRKAEKMPDRAFRFLRSVGLFPSIMSALYEVGYSEDIHRKGWELLHQASGFQNKTQNMSEKHHNAIVELDNWDEKAFRRTHATLQYLYPEQTRYIFQDLEAQKGYEAIQAVQIYIERVSTLREGTDPKRTASREKDREAVELLAQRKIFDHTIEVQLKTWIESAQSLSFSPEHIEEQKVQKAELEHALIDLVIWFDEWSEAARSVVERRDYLISLGLAKRRTKKEEETPEDPSETLI